MNEAVENQATPQSSPKFDMKPLILAFTLTVFSTVAAGLLAVGDTETRPEIALRLQEDLNAILSQVVPNDLHDNDLTKDIVTLPNARGKEITVYRARKGDEIIGFAYPTTAPSGYAGPVELVMGVNSQGEILGVRVLSHSETPGLGDKIELAKTDWILSFNGKSFANLAYELWGVKKDGGVFDQFSGATITPRIVVAAVKDGLDFFHNNQAKLFATSKPAPADPTPAKPAQDGEPK